MFRGTLVGIFTAPSSGEPMHEHPRIDAVAGCGLAGDRYAADVALHDRGNTKVRHVTLLEEETVAALRRDHGIDVKPILLRRNLLTRGVPLSHLVGRRFRVGGVVLEGTELAEPCDHLAGLIGLPVLEPLIHRAGIRAAIVVGGELRPGDAILPLDEGGARGRGAPAAPSRAQAREGPSSATGGNQTRRSSPPSLS
jgi:MOSC domain-containing protein YiiM